MNANPLLETLQTLLGTANICREPIQEASSAFAPSNIALIKYWGKRCEHWNLPLNDSLSISLGERGTTMTLSRAEKVDVLSINGARITTESPIYQRLFMFLSVLRPHPDFYFNISSASNIPIQAGLASSASAFAALVLALNDWFGWELSLKDCSLLARIGSGSACRSLWQGFVHWKAGNEPNGLDSFASPITSNWSDLCIGLLILDTKPKAISSRTGMQHCYNTSPVMSIWPQQAALDLRALKQAIMRQDIHSLGSIAESNALLMHAAMLSSRPALSYDIPETIQQRQIIWEARKNGIGVYFTQDAGPNIKLIFESTVQKALQTLFPAMQVIRPLA